MGGAIPWPIGMRCVRNGAEGDSGIELISSVSPWSASVPDSRFLLESGRNPVLLFLQRVRESKPFQLPGLCMVMAFIQATGQQSRTKAHLISPVLLLNA